MRTKKSHSLGGTGLLVLAVLFLALTMLSNNLLRGQRLDLTENQLYTLSAGSTNRCKPGRTIVELNTV